MEFIKKHYEKILLSAVLLGLVGALVFLPFLINADRDRVEQAKAPFIGRSKQLDPLNMTRQDNVVARLNSPYNLDFSTTNKLFNPVEWQRDASGHLIKIATGREVGIDAAVVTKITPLYLVVTLDAVQTNELGVIYVIGMERQAAPYLQMRHKQQHYATAGEKISNAFTLPKDGVKGDPANPDELILKLADTGETAVVSKDKPFQRVDGYEADLKYDPENKNFPGRRVGSTVSFGGENYLIVAIGQNEVIFSAQSNQKKTALRYAP
jgi:hypothetical protein